MAIDRHFIGWDGPALPRVAEYLVERYATKDEFDLSSVILVFPGRRAGRRMLELLVERSSGTFPDFVPPRMVTFSQLPELLYPQQKPLADELTRLLVWKHAISQIPTKELSPALTQLPPEDALSTWIRLCGSLKNQHDELAGEGLDFADVVETLAKSGSRDETNRWVALRRIQSEYLMQMDGLELWDRQTARLFAVDQHECVTQHDIILVGTVDMNGINRRMLDQVAEHVTAIVCAPPTMRDAFDEWGCLVPESWQRRQISIPDSVTIVTDDPQDQAAAVVQVTAELGATRRADELVIAVADDALVPGILQSLERAGAQGRWPVGARLNASPPWRLLDAVAGHLSTAQSGELPDFASLADLIRHADVSRFVESALQADNQQAPESWLAEFDEYLARHLQTVPDRMLGSPARAAMMEVICRSVERLLSQLAGPDQHATAAASSGKRRGRSPARGQQVLFDHPQEPASVHAQLQRRRPLSDWSVGALRLLGMVYSDYAMGENSARDQSMIACLDALSDLRERLAAIPQSVMPRCTAAQALPVLLMQLGELATAAEENPAAIDLTGWLELPLDDSPVVTVAGFNEGKIPQSVTSDIFLPNSVRSQLGLNDNARRYARDAWALESLLHNRDQLRLIAGRRDTQGDPLMPSRLWFAGSGDETADRIRQFYADSRPADEGSHDDNVLSATASQATASQAAASHATVEPGRRSGFTVAIPTPLPAAPDHIPVTHFRDYIECPYRYLLRRVLGVASVSHDPREMDARQFGNLIHTVLNRFSESDSVHATSPEAVASVLQDLLHREADHSFGQQLSATVAVQLQMAEERLRAFADWQARQAADGWVIRYAECDLSTSFSDLRGRAVTINGRIDRIDFHEASGEWRVLDYKTSERASRPQETHRRRGEWVDLQLPLYRLLVRELDISSEVQLGYINLPGDLQQLGESLADWDRDDLASAEETARSVAADILDLRLDRIAAARNRPFDELTRICQDTVVDRDVPWLQEPPAHADTNL